ncbi:hypothetical protein [Thermopirellula anaerolimosa]
MGKRLLFYGALTVGGLLLVLLIVGGVLFHLATRVPAFYPTAAADPKTQAALNDRFLQKASTLTSDFQRAGRWDLRLTEDEVNAWLSTDLPRNHPNLLPPSLHEPRIRIGREELTAACRTEWGGRSAVLWVRIQVQLARTDVLAIRFRKAGVGLLPLSTASVSQRLEEALRRAGVDVGREDVDGESTLTIPLSAKSPDGRRRVHVDAVDFTDGHLFISGTTDEAGH